MLHNLPHLHQQTDCVYGDSSAADQLAPASALLSLSRAEGVGRSLLKQFGFRVHLSFLHDGVAEQAREKVFGTYSVQCNREVKFVRKVLF